MEPQKLRNVCPGMGLPPRAPTKPLTATDSHPLFLSCTSSNHRLASCRSDSLTSANNPIKAPLSINIDSGASSSRTTVTESGSKRVLNNVSSVLISTTNGQSNSGSDLNSGVDGVPSALSPSPAAPNDEEQRKLRRTLSNRLSAQRSRVKKLQYIVDLERKARALELKIASITPQVEFYKNRMSLLLIQQKSLSHRLAACAQKKLLVDAEIVQKKAKVERLRLRQLRQQQQRHRNASAAQWRALAKAGPNLELSLPGPSTTPYPTQASPPN